jgi:hypothetical protein
MEIRTYFLLLCNYMQLNASSIDPPPPKKKIRAKQFYSQKWSFFKWPEILMPKSN